MPPKKPSKEEEEQRLLEEQLRLEEEERARKEEEAKYEIVTLETGLQLLITRYYIQEAQQQQEFQRFSQDYLTTFLQKNGFAAFRQVDIENLTYQLISDLVHAKLKLHLDDEQALVFVNLFFGLYLQQSQTPAEDWIKFSTFLRKHSVDVKTFQANTLPQIIDYAKKTYPSRPHPLDTFSITSS